MQLIAILGAVLAGIGMIVGKNMARSGKDQGMLIQGVCGVVAIAFAIWAVYLELFGMPAEMKVDEAWRDVRGRYDAKVLKENFAGKKYAVILPNGSSQRMNAEYKSLKSALSEAAFVEFPAIMDPAKMMGPENPYTTGLRLTPQQKKEFAEMNKKFNDAVASAVKDADVVVFCDNENSFVYSMNKDGLKGKTLFFLFDPNDGVFNPRTAGVTLGGWITNKILPDPEKDYDVPPTGEDNADFARRYDCKIMKAKK